MPNTSLDANETRVNSIIQYIKLSIEQHCVWLIKSDTRRGEEQFFENLFP